MSKWFRQAGDINDSIVAALTGVQNLTGVSTVEAILSHPTIASVTLPGTVVSATDRTVSIALGGAGGWLATIAVPGETYSVEIRALWADGTRLSWPSNNIPDKLVIT